MSKAIIDASAAAIIDAPSAAIIYAPSAATIDAPAANIMIPAKRILILLQAMVEYMGTDE